ncbi:hypothetical protein PTTG_01617 [Puccinia triticina 1-1 BBBD Race 1]|uniref:Carboxypeptidase n=1 Tax=Puccinia triticina (isolate 1-1 / race 1 (BBBD)) TaxID=630390 RepID=A0A180GLT7_PUCT1|nr:hypothetical protein PTTG_01617 [Puccinia triticina 1-1 BBBD Race 1]
MLGVFRGNGPCFIKKDRTGFEVNPESWHENANMIFIDQPVGAGYSYGSRTARNTPDAMSELYDALQIWLSSPHFSKFVGRPFGVWTESYGGHYGPGLVDHILTMNVKLTSSSQKGRVVIPVQSLALGNALINAREQFLGYLTFAESNPYNQTLVPPEAIKIAYKHFYQPNSGCYDSIKTCQATLDPYKCRHASSYCATKVFAVLAGDRNVYDVREDDSNPYPPNLTPVLNDSKFKASMGVPSTVQWVQCNDDIDEEFESSGDWMRDYSKQLERIINSGVRTLLYAGDADFRVNYQGMEKLVDSLKLDDSKSLVNQNFTNWYIGEEKAGIYKTASTFTYLRLFGAGHEVPAYATGNLPRGRAAKAFFDQIISNMTITSLKA